MHLSRLLSVPWILPLALPVAVACTADDGSSEPGPSSGASGDGDGDGGGSGDDATGGPGESTGAGDGDDDPGDGSGTGGSGGGDPDTGEDSGSTGSGGEGDPPGPTEEEVGPPRDGGCAQGEAIGNWVFQGFRDVDGDATIGQNEEFDVWLSTDWIAQTELERGKRSLVVLNGAVWCDGCDEFYRSFDQQCLMPKEELLDPDVPCPGGGTYQDQIRAANGAVLAIYSGEDKETSLPTTSTLNDYVRAYGVDPHYVTGLHQFPAEPCKDSRPQAMVIDLKTGVMEYIFRGSGGQLPYWVLENVQRLDQP